MSDFQNSQHQPWPEVERRAPPALPPMPGNPSDPVTKEYLDHALQEWRHASREYFNMHFARLEQKIDDGFPGGDARAHREVHEGYIKRAEDRSEMWRAVVKTCLTGGVWAAGSVLLVTLWVAFKNEIRK